MNRVFIFIPAPIGDCGAERISSGKATHNHFTDNSEMRNKVQSTRHVHGIVVIIRIFKYWNNYVVGVTNCG